MLGGLVVFLCVNCYGYGLWFVVCIRILWVFRWLFRGVFICCGCCWVLFDYVFDLIDLGLIARFVLFSVFCLVCFAVVCSCWLCF